MSGKTVMAVAVVLTLGANFDVHAMGVGVGSVGLPPSITQPGWPNSSDRNRNEGYNRDCYESRRVHTQYGMRWRRVWVCD
jgi:hypothetical protein